MPLDERLLADCTRYSYELGADYQRLYKLKECGASEDVIRAQKSKIKADKDRLRHTIKRQNGG